MKHRPIVLLILDGWGVSSNWGGNAITMNNPKNMDQLWRSYPHTMLKALSFVDNDNPVTDSRLGHALIGTGRQIKTNSSKISEKIKDRSFFHNETMIGAINWAKKNKSNLHLIGLVSDGGVHAQLDHLLAILKMCREQDFDRVYIDAITDGIDSNPTEAVNFLMKISAKMESLRVGHFSSIGGRAWAMDRSNDWIKVGKYFNTIIGQKAPKFSDFSEAIKHNYQRNLTDDLIEPALILDQNKEIHPLKKNDAVIMFNFREDRSKQLARIIIDQKAGTTFNRFKRIEDLYFATFINYDSLIPAKIVFPTEEYKNSLSEVLAGANLKQLKIAESEKASHVTTFLNGGIEDTFVGEDRKIIPSIKADLFEKHPDLSSFAITDQAVKAIQSNKYDLIIVNFAAVDLVAHSGNIIATGKAVRAVDRLVRVITATNLKKGGTTIITADHGNAEQMVLDKNSNLERANSHSLNPVPFILVTPDYRKNLLKSAISYQANALSKILGVKDNLADVAPTILELLNIPKPAEMTGHSLLKRLE